MNHHEGIVAGGGWREKPQPPRWLPEPLRIFRWCMVLAGVGLIGISWLVDSVDLRLAFLVSGFTLPTLAIALSPNLRAGSPSHKNESSSGSLIPGRDEIRKLYIDAGPPKA